MRRLVLTLCLLAIPAFVQAQTVTPNFQFTTTDSLTKVTGYLASLKLGAGALTQVTLSCTANGTGALCVVPMVGFDQTKAQAVLVQLTDPTTGLTTGNTLNYVPGQPPAAFVLVPGWKVTIP